jgi:two-component system, NarL family, response regulator DesR
MIRIVIAEEQPMLLNALGSLLNLEEDMEVVGQVNNGKEALSLVNELRPHICLIDNDLSQQNGLEVAKELRELGCKVIILTTFAHNNFRQRAMSADISGYLLKDSPSDMLANSIRMIMDGKQVFVPEVLEEVEDMDNMVIEKVDHNQLPNNSIQSVKAYITTIMNKMKTPVG